MSPIATLAALSMLAAQGAPPDVPKDHWAYKAVDELYRDGILVGYPNGTFNGSRPLTRYELASALNLGFQSAKKQVQNLKVPPQPTSGIELEALRIRLQSLQNELDGIKANKADIDALKATMDSLRTHLQQIKGQTNDLREQLDKAKGRATSPTR